MRAGVTMFIQNYEDWDRFEALERGEEAPPLEPNTDASIWAEEIETALKIEGYGFDSIWVVEHHVTPYTMITNPLQALSFFAGATTTVDVGTMVVVLPWHNPLRVAEDMAMLQFMLRGRRAHVGVGRGLGRREFKALGVDMNDSAGMLAESIEVIQLALTHEKFCYDGEHYQYDDTMLRPRPRDGRQLIDDMCFSWGSPTSAPVGARYGLKPLIIPQKPFDEYRADLAAFAGAANEAGHATARPRIHVIMYCHEDADTAHEMMRRHVPEYVDAALRNYELASSHFKELKGYEHYSGAYQEVASTPLDDMAQVWNSNAVWGTPEMCLEKIRTLCEVFHPEELMFAARFGSMTQEEAESSLELFAREVLPAVHEIPSAGPIAHEQRTA